MKKLKKLTRKGLDELANEMPEMKEVEQRECMGSVRYYDYYGYYLFESGSFDTLGYYNNGSGVDLWYAPTEVAKNVAFNIASNIYIQGLSGIEFGTPHFNFNTGILTIENIDPFDSESDVDYKIRVASLIIEY